MSVTNEIWSPTSGKDPKKFSKIQGFSSHCPTDLQKRIVPNIRLAGKIGDFIRKTTIYEFYEGYNYNGYGYEDHTRYILISAKDARTLMKMIKEKERTTKKRKKPTEEEKMKAWARRLVKLVPAMTELDFDEAMEIAQEKLDYQEERIGELEQRQEYRYSVKRQSLINKIARENPLRRITGQEHARRILAAHRRHKDSDYDYQLEEAHDLAAWGHIDYSEVRDYAVRHMRYRDEESDIEK